MTSAFSKNADNMDVRYVAHLARVKLSDEEIALFQGQLDHILAHVKTLSGLNVDGVEPTAHAMPIQNVFRRDEPRPCLDREKVLKNAPHERNGQFVVPKIVE